LTFVVLMLPIHLAVGIMEGIVTAAVVAWFAKAITFLMTWGLARHKQTMKVEW
jgi:ABC-type Co2+ transport system permease subunit